MEGRSDITVSLFEASEYVDSGPIYSQQRVQLKGTELIGELRALLATRIVSLCENFVTNYPESANKKKKQVGSPTYYRRREAEDSKIDIDKSIRDQINLLRIADSDRYPAWFEMNGVKFSLNIKKIRS